MFKPPYGGRYQLTARMIVIIPTAAGVSSSITTATANFRRR
jgi:hypothetical protein